MCDDPGLPLLNSIVPPERFRARLEELVSEYEVRQNAALTAENTWLRRQLGLPKAFPRQRQAVATLGAADSDPGSKSVFSPERLPSPDAGSPKSRPNSGVDFNDLFQLGGEAEVTPRWPSEDVGTPKSRPERPRQSNFKQATFQSLEPQRVSSQDAPQPGVSRRFASTAGGTSARKTQGSLIMGPMETQSSALVGSGKLSLPPLWPSVVTMREELTGRGPSLTGEVIECAFQHKERMFFRGSLVMRGSTLNLQVKNLAQDFEGAAAALGGEVRTRFSSFFMRLCSHTLHPNSSLRTAVDAVCMLALVHDLAVTPYVLAWSITVSGTLQVFANFATVFWTLDVAMSFMTGFYVHGELERRWLFVAQNYFRTWFVPDVVLVVGDWIGFALTQRGTDSGASFEVLLVLRIAKVSRLFRVSGFLRLARLNKAAEKKMAWFLSDNSQLLFQVIKFFIGTMFVNHLACCIWFIIGKAAPTDTGARWLDDIQRLCESGDDAGCSFHEANNQYQYWTAFHWTIAQITLAGVELYPVNTLERIFNILLQLFGLLFGSTLVSMFSSVTLQIMMKRRDQTTKLNTLRKFLRQNAVHPSLAAQAQQEVMERLDHRRDLGESDVPALDMLSSSLRSELLFETRRPHLVTHSLFRLWMELDVAAVKLLCRTALEFRHLCAGDELFAPGFIADSAYCIVSGRLRYTQEPDSSMVGDSEVTMVGEEQWLCEAALWSHWTHVGRLEALAHSNAMGLRADAMMEVLRTHHVIGHMTKTYGRNFHCRIVSAMPPYAPWPNDLEVSFTDVSDLVSPKVGLRILKHAEKMGLGMSEESIAKLEDELLEEKCALRWGSSDSVLERTVFVVAVRLECQGRIWVQVGKWDDKRGITPTCLLPGTKRGRGELPHDVVSRIISEDLAPFKNGLQLTSTNFDTQVKESDSFSIRTRYVRTEQVARLDPEYMAPESGLWKAPRRTDTQGGGSELEACDVFIFIISGKVLFFSWLPPTEFDVLSKLTSKQVIKGWLDSSFELDTDVLQGLTDVAPRDSLDVSVERGESSPYLTMSARHHGSNKLSSSDPFGLDEDQALPPPAQSEVSPRVSVVGGDVDCVTQPPDLHGLLPVPDCSGGASAFADAVLLERACVQVLAQEAAIPEPTVEHVATKADPGRAACPAWC